MANIRITANDIEGLVSVDTTYCGDRQTVLGFLGYPVLYGPAALLDEYGAAEELTDDFKQRIARALGKLLLAEGDLKDWQAEPIDG